MAVQSLHYDLMYLVLFFQAYLCVLLLCEFIYGKHQVLECDKCVNFRPNNYNIYLRKFQKWTLSQTTVED